MHQAGPAAHAQPWRHDCGAAETLNWNFTVQYASQLGAVGGQAHVVGVPRLPVDGLLGGLVLIGFSLLGGVSVGAAPALLRRAYVPRIELVPVPVCVACTAAPVVSSQWHSDPNRTPNSPLPCAPRGPCCNIHSVASTRAAKLI